MFASIQVLGLLEASSGVGEGGGTAADRLSISLPSISLTLFYLALFLSLSLIFSFPLLPQAAPIVRQHLLFARRGNQQRSGEEASIGRVPAGRTGAARRSLSVSVRGSPAGTFGGCFRVCEAFI